MLARLHIDLRALSCSGLGLAALAASIGLSCVRITPILLFNATASEPVGWYVLGDALPAKGQIIAFSPPAPARGYIAGHMQGVTSFLKQVAASSGDRACVRGGKLSINSVVLGPVFPSDSHGDRLPHWAGCRRLNSDELFVFSTRARNSFDSRYFGPVKTSEVIGVFHALYPMEQSSQ